ncbi:MAG: aryl-sulfate sulfotransferase [Bacteroidota bacterium]
MKTLTVITAFCLLTLSALTGQTRTVGLFLNDTSKVFKGYTLFAPKQNTMTYLINNEGRIVHQWTASKFPPGQSVYLLENGNLLRTCMTKGNLSSGGGEGGRIEEYNWNDSLVWSMDFSTTTYMQHHDIHILPNGNIIMLVIEKKTYAEAIAAGFNPAKFQPEIAQKGMMLPDYIAEVKRTYPTGGTVVWEWHTWDHLIQDFDATKLNYGVVKDHPELVDAAGDQKNLPAFWNHMNSIDYHPAFDQIALSVRGNSEVWIIDHSTTTAEAKSHSGGKRGKGGDLLYRWGNPVAYRSGTVANQRYFQQHDVEWVNPGSPGAGNLTCFNNGLGRGNYSTADEFTPAVDSAGNYSMTAGSAASPANLSWTFKYTPVGDTMYSENISGAYRLANGNTIICSGTVGQFYEVTSAGQLVWRYVCPVDQFGRITQGFKPHPDTVRAGELMNSVFRVYKYPLNYSAFTGRDLTPGSYVELYSSGVEQANQILQSFTLDQNYPNPFNPSTTIQYTLAGNSMVRLAVYDLLGREAAVLVNSRESAGTHSVEWNAEQFPSGVYFYRLSAGGLSVTKKLILEK